MKTNQLVLRIGITVMILMAVLYLLFIYVTKLNSPVFLRHCMDVELPYIDNQSNNTNYFSLNYITNTVDQSSVVGISFPEAPEILCSASESLYQSGFMYSSDQGNGIVYGRYSYRTVYVYISNFDSVNSNGEKVVHKAEIQLNNGKTHTVDIGTIVFYHDQKNLDHYIENRSSQSSSDGTASIEYQINPKIELLSVKSVLLDAANDISYFRMNDYDYKEFPPESYENDGRMYVSYQVNGLDTPYGTYDYYDIKPKLYYQDPDGNIKYYRMFCNSNCRYFSDFGDVLYYLIERGIW